MDLLERYLQAIGQYLPDDKKADILAELRANLLDQMDARAEELSHPLTELDVAAILREHGKPEMVALRYLPQQSLIGPTVYPFWRLTLRRVVPIVIFLYFVVEAITLVAEGRTPAAWTSGVAHALFGLIPVLLLNAAIVTIVFACIEAAIRNGKRPFDSWDPLKLPSVSRFQPSPGTKARSFGLRLTDLAVHCLWMIYVLAIPRHPFLVMGPGVLWIDKLPAAPGPIWHSFYLGLIGVLILQLIVRIIAMFPAADGFRSPLKLFSELVSLGFVGWLAFNGPYFVANGPHTDLVRLGVVNQGIGLSMRLALLFITIGIIKELWTLSKRWVPREKLVF